MDKAKYLRLLRYYLRGLPRHRVEEILDEYRSSFALGVRSGESEQEICMRLGHPRGVSEQYQNRGKRIVNVNRSPSQKILIASALILLSLVILLPMFAVLIIIVAAMFAASFIFGASGALLFVFSTIELFVSIPFVILDIFPISALFFSVAAMSLGLLLGLALKPCAATVFRLIYGCIVWTIDTARGIRRI